MVKQAQGVRVSRGDRVFSVVSCVLILILTVSVLYPVIYIISSSFSSPDAVVTGKVRLVPVDFSLTGYNAVFNYPNLWVGYKNTLFYTLVGTLINIVMTMICAYPLARSDLRGRGFITFLFSFTMIFSGGMIPNYLLMKNIGLLNTRLSMLLPGALNVYNMIVARTFIKSNISQEMLEASRIDGCSDAKFFVSIVVPLSKSIIAVLALWYAVEHWNAYFDAFLYLTDKQKYPLQIFLKDILCESQIAASMVESADHVEINNIYVVLKYAMIVIATLPMFCFYPFAEKNFVRGVMIGSVKG